MTRVVGSCPMLAPPPSAAVDALEGANDRDVDAWAIELSNHFRKLEICSRST